MKHYTKHTRTQRHTHIHPTEILYDQVKYRRLLPKPNFLWLPGNLTPFARLQNRNAEQQWSHTNTHSHSPEETWMPVSLWFILSQASHHELMYSKPIHHRVWWLIQRYCIIFFCWWNLLCRCSSGSRSLTLKLSWSSAGYAFKTSIVRQSKTMQSKREPAVPGARRGGKKVVEVAALSPAETPFDDFLTNIWELFSLLFCQALSRPLASCTFIQSVLIFQESSLCDWERKRLPTHFPELHGGPLEM